MVDQMHATVAFEREDQVLHGQCGGQGSRHPKQQLLVDLAHLVVAPAQDRFRPVAMVGEVLGQPVHVEIGGDAAAQV
jgi:hypothetical protein